jgi:spectinomycin phosphotransferase
MRDADRVRAEPEGLDTAAVVDALREGWDVEVDAAEYLPVGAGSYHWRVLDSAGCRRFVTVDDLDQKSWLGDDRATALDGLRAAFDTAVALRAGGLPFVVAPIPTGTGESLRPLGPRHTIALFPFLEGAAGGSYEEDGDRLAVAELLGALHRTPLTVAPAAAAVGLAIPGRHHLEAALADLDEPWSAGPLSERARGAVADAASDLALLLTLADRLAADAERGDCGWVVTHGEPHPRNMMRTVERRVLVDWDTVALAPPERDLWLVLGDPAGPAAERYSEVTGRSPDAAALEYYHLVWELKDLAEYLKLLRAPHREDEDTLRACGSLTRCRAIREWWEPRLA